MKTELYAVDKTKNKGGWRMKTNSLLKVTTMFCVMILIAMSFYSINFGSIMGTASSSNIQPDNTFEPMIFGGEGEQENDMYGWNLTYIDNLNGDDFVDLVVGTPWFDTTVMANVGAVYIFYGQTQPVFDNLSHSKADVVIRGDIDGDNFGWSVADAGDINNDGINDLIVGAPRALNGKGRAYIFYGGSLPNGNYIASESAVRVLDGTIEDSYYGSSVAGVGDLNGDGWGEVAVGAPELDQTIITYGYRNKVTIYPDLWDDDPTTKGVVQFDSGVSNTMSDSNTWGLEGADDGWDWIDSFHDPTDLYGQTTPAPHDHATIYAPWEIDGPDADGLTWANKTALEVMVGRNHSHYNPYGSGWDWDPAASAAWGIEFTITPEMYTYISSNSTISIAFNFGAMDANKVFNSSNLSRRFSYSIRSRIWNNTIIDYLGDVNIESEKYVFFKQDNWNVPPWGPIYDKFESDITDYIDGPGSYYWDFGCYFDREWSTRYDDGMWAFFDNITMKIVNERSAVIQGVKNSGFGTSIVAVGDIDNDDSPDMLIGAPDLDAGHVVMLNGNKPLKMIESMNLATITLTGAQPGDKFGYSLANAGDVDNDGISDVIIGAPGGNYAHLYYGSTLNSPLLLPDLSEKNLDSDTPHIEFNSGLKSTGNTPGLSGPADGWDAWNGVYGYQSGGTPGSSVTYNGANGLDPAQVAIDQELIIAIGGGLGGGSTIGAKPDSGAYGVEFSVSQAMVSAINAGGSAVLSYDWSFENVGLDLDDTIWIKTYIRSDSGDHDLGWDLDSYSFDNANKDDTNEVHWADTPEDMKSVFIQDCSECFTAPGDYYLDIGAKLRNFWWDTTWEDGIFHFDNIYLRINPAPDVKFIGPVNSSFGYSVGASKKLNIDDYEDIIIGSPNYDSPNGVNSGAVYGFIMGPDTEKLREAETAEFIAYGEHAGDNFGWSLLGEKSLDSDEFSEIITSAINYDSPTNNAGKIYLLSITLIPKIRLRNPAAGEVLTGLVTVNASVSDPDWNIDNAIGVYFYYSTNKVDWIAIGNDVTPTEQNSMYELTWNTTQLADGTNYYLKCWVQDLERNNAENYSGALTIDNPHPPQIEIQHPTQGSIVEGSVKIEALVEDSELDTIGAGINNTKGVEFYLSTDGETWDIIVTQHTEDQNVYSTILETTAISDGEYFIKVNAIDLDGFEVEEIVSFEIDNPMRSPEISFVSPYNVTELSGRVSLIAAAFDYDMDINNSGVSFYVAPELEPLQWQNIGNDPEPEINNSGAYVYSFMWDTTTIADDWYHLKAVANDTEGLTNVSMITGLKVHNHDKNPPNIRLISPQDGATLMESEMITVRVRDLEDNIGSQGVNYYYSEDKVQWRYIGTAADSRIADPEYYDFIWNTGVIPDGMYWLNVSIEDDTGLRNSDVSGKPLFIHNSKLNPPEINVLEPTRGQCINGTFNLKVTATDLENNINQVGVVFYYSIEGQDWSVLSNVITPTNSDSHIYELSWNTLAHQDGKYWIKAEVSDSDGLMAEAYSDYFFIHNHLDNSPVVELLYPNSGELYGQVRLNATVFDLENNVNNNGVMFYYSTDNTTWKLIGNDDFGNHIGEEIYYYEITWNTLAVSDDIYMLRVEVFDLTDNNGVDVSNEQVMVHNKRDNPPKISFKTPNILVPLSELESIVVEVIDFESDVESVSFYYSTDNESWELIDTRLNPEKDNLYKTYWNTNEVYNGKYYIKIQAKDKLGNHEELIMGPFVVTEGKEKKASSDAEFPYWIIVVIIIIVIMSQIIFMIIRRSKQHEKEIIEEVATELRRSMEHQGEGGTETDVEPGVPTVDADTVGPTQTYISPSEMTTQVPKLPIGESTLNFEEPEPDVETIEYYRYQLEAWKAEGFNTSVLEQLSSTDEFLFAKTFPVVNANISKLKTISSKLESMNITGYESQVSSLRSKLFDPDQVLDAEREFNDLKFELGFVPRAMPVSSASVPPSLNAANTPSPGSVPQLPKPEPQIDDLLPDMLPAGTPPDEVTPETNIEPITEQSDIPVSPYVAGCEHDPEMDEADIPVSPFSNVQTQSLEEELDGNADIVEIPDED